MTWILVMDIWNPTIGLMSLSPTIGKQWEFRQRTCGLINPRGYAPATGWDGSLDPSTYQTHETHQTLKSRLATEKPHSTKTTQHLHVVREFEMKSTPDHHLDIQSFQGILGEDDGKTVHFGHQKHIETHKSWPTTSHFHHLSSRTKRHQWIFLVPLEGGR